MQEKEILRETRDLASLNPNPLQEKLHGVPHQQKVDELAADIDLRGLLQPIEILPDGTVLCGHHRLAALLKLGMTKAEVIVRYDLAAATSAERTEHFIKDNLVRNQHGPLSQARMIVALDDALVELVELGDVNGRRRDRLAEALSKATGHDVSGKTIERRLKLLELPVVLQHLVDSETITQAKALLIVKLPRRVQEELAEKVSQSNDVRATVDQFVADRAAGRVTQRTFDGLVDRVVRLCKDVNNLKTQSTEALAQRVARAGIDVTAFKELEQFISRINEVSNDAD